MSIPRMLIPVTGTMLVVQLSGLFEIVPLAGHAHQSNHQDKKGKNFHRRATYPPTDQNAIPSSLEMKNSHNMALPQPNNHSAPPLSPFRLPTCT